MNPGELIEPEVRYLWHAAAGDVRVEANSEDDHVLMAVPGGSREGEISLSPDEAVSAAHALLAAAAKAAE